MIWYRVGLSFYIHALLWIEDILKSKGTRQKVIYNKKSHETCLLQSIKKSSVSVPSHVIHVCQKKKKKEK